MLVREDNDVVRSAAVMPRTRHAPRSAENNAMRYVHYGRQNYEMFSPCVALRVQRVLCLCRSPAQATFYSLDSK